MGNLRAANAELKQKLVWFILGNILYNTHCYFFVLRLLLGAYVWLVYGLAEPLHSEGVWLWIDSMDVIFWPAGQLPVELISSGNRT